METKDKQLKVKLDEVLGRNKELLQEKEQQDTKQTELQSKLQDI